MRPRQQRKHEEKINYWRPHIAAWQSSQMTVRHYCEQQSVNPAQFKYWQYQIAPETKQPSKKLSSSSQQFTEITPRLLSSLSTPAMELLLPNGYLLKIPMGCDVSQLMVIVNGLRGLTC